LRFSRSIFSLLLSCLLLGACADVAEDGPERYVVLPADTLYSIAWRHDIDYRDLARWNNIGSDFHISVGQVLVLGPLGIPVTPARKPVTSAPDLAASRVQNPPRVGPVRPLSANDAALKWVWPTDRDRVPRATPGGGILLSGHLGQDVRAASTGRVVYTGSGLRGYGNLIIIKHGDSLLSAYAHNREMLVHDGQEVAMGQVIAHMGEDSHQSPVLYFEIRRDGRPVDPLAFLSKIR
jgi:lipoprotein NlpD